MSTDIRTRTAIEANLAVLTDSLQRAATLALMASAAMVDDYRNLAMGTILPLEQELPEMTGLVTAILALHRRAGQRGEP